MRFTRLLIPLAIALGLPLSADPSKADGASDDQVHAVLVALRKRVPVATDISFLFDNEHVFKCLEVTGMVEDVFRDETNSRYTFIVVRAEGHIVYATLKDCPKPDAELQSLVGARATLCGFIVSNSTNKRAQLGPTLYLVSPDDIRVVAPAPANRFAVPEIGDLRNLPPQKIALLGPRRAVGLVRAVWQRNSVLIETTNVVPLVRLDLAVAQPPRVGERVEAVGHPETDIHRINLTRAVWRPATGKADRSEPAASDVTASEILEAKGRSPGIQSEFYGALIRMEGRVLGDVDTNGRFLMQSGKHTIPVDVSALSPPVTACASGTVRVTGRCVMSIENWRPNAAFPGIREVFIVPRSADDVVVLSRPPWWTPVRLLAVIGTLALTLIAVLVWNRALRIAAARLGHKLMREEFRKAKADLRVAERTRLAAELHDSLSQVLTGVSLEIEAAKNGKPPLSDDVRGHLEFAAKALRYCRNDIRYQLWDLRNMSLDESTMTNAVVKTLTPHMKDTKISVRFNVPRSKFSDNATQALLKTIRELAVNAIRHGGATSIMIAGEMDSDWIMCSVRDNGRGFDPETAPGIDKGHFGLQGVRERIAELGGSVSISSRRGAGTKVTIKIRRKALKI